MMNSIYALKISNRNEQSSYQHDQEQQMQAIEIEMKEKFSWYNQGEASPLRNDYEVLCGLQQRFSFYNTSSPLPTEAQHLFENGASFFTKHMESLFLVHAINKAAEQWAAPIYGKEHCALFRQQSSSIAV